MDRPEEEHVECVPVVSGGPGTPEAAAGATNSSAHSEPETQTIDFAEPSPEPDHPAYSQQDDPTRPSVVVTPEQLKDLANTLGATHLQGLRVANFAFEPVSLPASRIASHEDDSHHASRQQTPTPVSSPRLSSRALEMHSPPLTPSGTPHLDSGRVSPRISTDGAPSSPRGVITPQESTHEANIHSPPAKLAVYVPHFEEDGSRRPKSSSAAQDPVLLGNHRKGMFSFGPATTSSSADGGGGSGGSGSGGKSLPVSRDSSPSRNDPASQFYTRPFTPSGDTHDPYAANKRQPQHKIEPRFVFSKLSRRKDTSRTSSSVSVNKMQPSLHHHHHQHSSRKDNKDGGVSGDDMSHSRQGSMSDLRRFFKLGPSHHHKIKRAVSPAVSVRSANKTFGSKSFTQIPFGDEHSLTSKYGKLGKVLGSGAGGSVRLMKRSEDNTVFAVKEFRPRHNYENEKDYVKKLTAEYCIGSSLHHGNIIETLDIIREKTKWYEVMEYAPYDLFAIVMTGKMSRAEIACCFLQILSGVTYLHSMGLAHRDLKLDNVVVSEHGIMKIIDFGSAHVFKYPFENGIVMATGIVGSDPYLAPEVYDEKKYDPTAVDIWSLAIIYCCMTLRRFPWKVPRLTDNSYRLFAAEPTPGHDPKHLTLTDHTEPHREARRSMEKKDRIEHEHDAGEIKKAGPEMEENKTDKVDKAEKIEAPEKVEKVEKLEETERLEKADNPARDPAHDPAHKHTKGHAKDGKDGHAAGDDKTDTETKSEKPPPEKKEVIKGPWRILRLLPRESRHAIGGMLKVDPKERISMSELLKDPWVANTVICRQIEPGRVLRASTHTHILEQPTPAMK